MECEDRGKLKVIMRLNERYGRRQKEKKIIGRGISEFKI